MRTWLLVITVACATACDDRPPAAGFTFLHPAPGKADGQALLPLDDLQRLDAKLTVAIAAADQEIASLESQIASLEQQLSQKQAQVSSLLNQIQQRRDQVRTNLGVTVGISLLGVLFGIPPVAALGVAGAIAQDVTLQSLNQQLASATSERDQVQAQVNTYQARRNTLRAQLDPLKASYAALKALLAGGAPPALKAPDGVDATQWSEVAQERGRLDTLGQVLANAEQQVAILEKLLGLVQAANSAVDDALAVMKQLADAADAEAKKSTEQLNSLIKILLSGDPEAAAEQWLEDALAEETRQVLKALGWPSNAFVDFLLHGVTDGDLQSALNDVLNTTLTLQLKKTTFAVGESITVGFTAGPAALLDWIDVLPKGADLLSTDASLWVYVGGATATPQTAAVPAAQGTLTLGPGSDGATSWPLSAGTWTAHYMANNSYSELASIDFTVK
jgi:hypothetical protein